MKFQYLILLPILLACTPQTSENSLECIHYELVYISKASGNFDIFRNNLEGKESQLTTNPSFDWSPMWNSQLQSIIYYAYVNDTFRIRNMDIDGNLLELKTKGLQEFNLSPDASTVVMEETHGDGRQLVLISLETLTREPITDSTAYNGRAKWSPDSKQLAYISDQDGNNEVYLYNSVSQETKRLTTNETQEKYLSWGPESKRLAFTTEYYEEGKPDRNDVFIMDLMSEEITQITDNPFEDSEIAWSPTGDRIAFHSKRDSVDHIFTMDPDGFNVKQITTEFTYHGEPAWIAVACQSREDES